MEHAMGAAMRVMALVLLLIGLGSGPLSAQANPPPGNYPPPPPPPNAPPPANQPPPAAAPPQRKNYPPEDVDAARRRFCGASPRGAPLVVQTARRRCGLADGDVLGQEAGGAVVAGLRYGEGILYTKNAGDLRVFWQGPSLGWDFGGEGARTMMLIYSLPATGAIYQRFAGIDGSAYFVGGLGMTALTSDGIVVVPIRTGVGLRLGANVGYVKFTPTATWNPF